MTWIVILTLLAAPSTVYANERCVDEHFLLPSREFTVHEEISYMSFDIVNSKKLLLQLSCGSYFRDRLKIQGKLLVIANDAVDAYKDINDAQTKKINFLQDDRSRVVDMWREENKKRHIAENKPSYGWLAAGILSVTTLSFGVAFLLK